MEQFNIREENSLWNYGDEQSESFGCYENTEKCTIDGEWTEDELRDDIWDEAKKILHGDGKTKGWIEKNQYRFISDKSVLHEEFLVNRVLDNIEYDAIELYNSEYSKHNNDTDKLFGIHYFDEAVRKEMEKILKDGLVN